LVAVPQINAAPDWSLGENSRGPLPFGQGHWRERAIFGRRILKHVCVSVIVTPGAVGENKKPTAVSGDGFRKSGDALKPNRRRS